MALVQVSDLIRINSNAEWIEGSVEGRRDINRPGILVHIAIHEGRSVSFFSNLQLQVLLHSDWVVLI